MRKEFLRSPALRLHRFQSVPKWLFQDIFFRQKHNNQLFSPGDPIAPLQRTNCPPRTSEPSASCTASTRFPRNKSRSTTESVRSVKLQLGGKLLKNALPVSRRSPCFCVTWKRVLFFCTRGLSRDRTVHLKRTNSQIVSEIEICNARNSNLFACVGKRFQHLPLQSLLFHMPLTVAAMNGTRSRPMALVLFEERKHYFVLPARVSKKLGPVIKVTALKKDKRKKDETPFVLTWPRM